MRLMPVTFLPGRLRLSTRPIRTGSAACIKTIGIVWVAALAASAPCVLSSITITGYLTANQFGGQRLQLIVSTLCPSVFDRHVPILDVTGFLQALTKRGEMFTR